MDQAHIDGLLERYLALLDEYSRLREKLSRSQSAIFQNIARANFSGERGLRYGQDQYDERMQALRLLEIKTGPAGTPEFSLSLSEAPEQDEGKEDPEAEQEKEPQEKEKASTKAKPRNPLHWFGLFAPMPLRNAQTQSIQVLEDIIPRLVTINTEMLDVEIQVRRARKRRAKADAAGKAQKQRGSADGALAETGSMDTQPGSTTVQAS